MSRRELQQIGAAGHFYECPRWHDGQWWVSDFFAHRIHTIDCSGRMLVTAELDDQPGGLGWLPDGSLLVVSMTDARLLRLTNGRFDTYAELRSFFDGHANDLVVDNRGHAYVSNFGFDLTDPAAATVATCLVHVPPDAAPRVAADDLRFPNAMVLTRRGTELVVNETFASRHTAFTRAADGTLHDRRVWAQPFPEPANLDTALADIGYAPDGACLDPSGAIWAADAVGPAVLLVAEGGSILDRMAVPSGLRPYACALGGRDHDTLLITTAPAMGTVDAAATRNSLLFLAHP